MNLYDIYEGLKEHSRSPGLLTDGKERSRLLVIKVLQFWMRKGGEQNGSQF